MPLELFDFLTGASNLYYDKDQLVFFVKYAYFNQYSIYGLSVRYLSSVKQFIKEFRKNYLQYKNNLMNDDADDFLEIPISYNYQYFEEDYLYTISKKHLVSPEAIFKNIDKIIAKDNYNFYILSMVLLGGLGPQGHGFTYSTPKGEVIEICSDIKENEAIIVKYKQFLKQQFLERLEKELKKKNVYYIAIEKIINYLEEILNRNELINYYKKERILRKIKEFLNENQDTNQSLKINLYKFIDKISNAMNRILREIKMEDQFKTRMELVLRDEIKPEDIAKMTSLREKSHYDVLRERFFFQYIVDWFYEIYIIERYISFFKKCLSLISKFRLKFLI